MTRLLILGAGSFALEVLDIAEMAGGFEPVGFVVSSERPVPGATHAGLPVYWHEQIPFAPAECQVAAGIVSTRRRAFVESMLAREFRFASTIHPSAVVSRHARIEPGCVVNAGVIVSQGARVGPHVVLNRGCLIGHDDRIEPFATIGPGANLAGAVRVGEGSYVAVGAVVRDHLEIGAGAVVAAGAVVVRPVPTRALVAGVPARVVKQPVEAL